MYFGHVCPPQVTWTAPMTLPFGSIYACMLTSLPRAGFNRKQTKLLQTTTDARSYYYQVVNRRDTRTATPTRSWFRVS